MRKPKRLGGQKVTIYLRERMQHRTFRDTGETIVWEGCDFQPLEDAGETLSDNRVGETRRWRIFAPAGSRAPATAQCTVEPGGPVDADGAPRRLDLAGASESHDRRTGVEDHVTVVVRLVNATS